MDPQEHAMKPGGQEKNHQKPQQHLDGQTRAAAAASGNDAAKMPINSDKRGHHHHAICLLRGKKIAFVGS